jgi:hypothetical protein
MSALTAFFLIYAPVTIAVAMAGAGRDQRRVILPVVAVAWTFLGTLVYAVDGWMPFAGGGDDGSYFELANLPFDSLLDLLNVGRFTGFIEQPGFPWLLNIVYAFSGHDLYAYKLLNLCLLILIALVWRRIGTELDSPSFGNAVMVGVLLLTPLWYYTFFLLKDLAIVFLQTLFLWGAVRQWVRPSLASALLLVAPTLLIVLFRSPLVLQHVGVLVGVTLLKVWARGGVAGRIYALVIAGAVVVAVLALATNPDLMFMLGIYQEGRVLDTEATLMLAQDVQQESKIRWEIFPALYLLTETSGLSAEAWETFDAQWLRGVMALPWILFVLPFFFGGLAWLWRPLESGVGKGLLHRIRFSRALSTPWAAVLLFIITCASISFAAGDTTRWRIADMPAILAVAMAGARWMKAGTRWKILGGWIVGLGFLLSLYYLKAEL